MQALVLTGELLFANLLFNLIQRRDLFEGLIDTLRLVGMRLKEIAATVTPAQGVRDTDLLGVTVVRGKAVSQQHCAGIVCGTQCRTNVVSVSRGKERKADLVLPAVDGPEVPRLHLATAGSTGFDWRLIHRLDAAVADRVELCRIDRLEQPDPLLDQLCKPGAADADPAVPQALMLAIQ